jgi:hypothetical protein
MAKRKRTQEFSDQFLDDFMSAWNGKHKTEDGETQWHPDYRREMTNGEATLRKLATESPVQFAQLAQRVFAVSTPREEVKEVGENLAGILEGLSRTERDMGKIINGQVQRIGNS